MQFGRFRKALQFVAKPWTHAPYQKHLLEHPDMAIDGLAVHAQLSTELGEVHHLAAMLCEQLDEPGHVASPIKVGDVGYVFFDERLGICLEPIAAARSVGAGDCFGKAPRRH